MALLDQLDIVALGKDFKYRLFFIFSTLLALACLCYAIVRMFHALKGLREAQFSPNPKSKSVAIHTLAIRTLEVLGGVLIMVVDSILLQLTYANQQDSTVPSEQMALGELMIAVICLEPGAAIILTNSFSGEWFHVPKYILPAFLTAFCGAPMIYFLCAGSINLLSTLSQAFIYGCALNILNVIVLRFFFYWLTSTFVIMAYNEANARNINSKVILLYFSAFIDTAILILSSTSRSQMIMTINLLLLHIRLFISVAISINLDSLGRPSQLDGLDESAAGKVAPRTRSYSFSVSGVAIPAAVKPTLASIQKN